LPINFEKPVEDEFQHEIGQTDENAANVANKFWSHMVNTQFLKLWRLTPHPFGRNPVVNKVV